MVDHRSYHSLESLRLRLIPEYLNTYGDVVVQEKIHGSNISIVGIWKNGVWEWHLGSRKRWIVGDEKFNNIQKLFQENKEKIQNLFNDIPVPRHECVIRLYGEIFGGQYGTENTLNAIRTQREPNYFGGNDFAFFDIMIDGNYMPVLEMIRLVEKHGLRVAPVIYKGPLVDFLADFNVNSFQSVVSQRFYNLPFISTPNATEGITIRTTNPNPEGDEATILKWKQDWAVENRRVNMTSPSRPDNHSEMEQACLDMVNQARMASYGSKIPINDLTDPRLISTHVKEIVEDTMKDVFEEFPPHLNPEMKVKVIRRLVSRKVFPAFKNYLAELETRDMTTDQRILRLVGESKMLNVEINTLRLRLSELDARFERF